MRYLAAIAILFLTSCTVHRTVKIQYSGMDGKNVSSIITCKVVAILSECGDTYQECDDGKSHGCGFDLYMEVK